MPSNSKSTRLQYLFQKYISDTGTPDEVKEFWQLFEELEEDDSVKNDLWKLWDELKEEHPKEKRNWENALERIMLKNAEWEKHSIINVRKLYMGRFAAAASIIFLLGLGLYFLFISRPTKELAQITTKIEKKDIAPGGNKAVLTLANGTKITLDSAKNGMLSMQGNTKIIKLNKGQLSYNQPKKNKSKVLFNTITTPNGGQYEVILSDGTKVWLNAASSIHFPNEFIGKKREVQITGEAYFEVKHNEKMPFKIQVNGMTVQVLGTHFNIMAYKNEPASKVTLLKGSVKLIKGNKEVLLSPGQQAQLDQAGRMEKIEGINLQGVTAWKNNQFWFNNDNIQTVMRKLSRWYNVDVVIKGDIPQHFEGFISRNVSVSKVFEALQATSHLSYKIEDNTIIVSP